MFVSLFNKVAGLQAATVFSCKYYKIFKNVLSSVFLYYKIFKNGVFIEHLEVATFDNGRKSGQEKLRA